MDIVSVDRIARAMENPKFLERILTSDERDLDLSPMRVAGRWAAKEALYKALRGGVQWQDVSILSTKAGAPEVVWHRPGIFPENARVHVSLSHEHNQAIAFVVIEGT